MSLIFALLEMYTQTYRITFLPPHGVYLVAQKHPWPSFFRALIAGELKAVSACVCSTHVVGG